MPDREIERDRDSRPEKIEQTGDTTFNVHHDDGSIFEMVGKKDIVKSVNISGQIKIIFLQRIPSGGTDLEIAQEL